MFECRKYKSSLTYIHTYKCSYVHNCICVYSLRLENVLRRALKHFLAGLAELQTHIYAYKPNSSIYYIHKYVCMCVSRSKREKFKQLRNNKFYELHCINHLEIDGWAGKVWMLEILHKLLQNTHTYIHMHIQTYMYQNAQVKLLAKGWQGVAWNMRLKEMNVWYFVDSKFIMEVKC